MVPLESTLKQPQPKEHFLPASARAGTSPRPSPSSAAPRRFRVTDVVSRRSSATTSTREPRSASSPGSAAASTSTSRCGSRENRWRLLTLAEKQLLWERRRPEDCRAQAARALSRPGVSASRSRAWISLGSPSASIAASWSRSRKQVATGCGLAAVDVEAVADRLRAVVVAADERLAVAVAAVALARRVELDVVGAAAARAAAPAREPPHDLLVVDLEQHGEAERPAGRLEGDVERLDLRDRARVAVEDEAARRVGLRPGGRPSCRRSAGRAPARRRACSPGPDAPAASLPGPRCAGCRRSRAAGSPRRPRAGGPASPCPRRAGRAARARAGPGAGSGGSWRGVLVRGARREGGHLSRDRGGCGAELPTGVGSVTSQRLLRSRRVDDRHRCLRRRAPRRSRRRLVRTVLPASRGRDARVLLPPHARRRARRGPDGGDVRGRAGRPRAVQARGSARPPAGCSRSA